MFLASLLDRSFAACSFRFARHAIGGTTTSFAMPPLMKYLSEDDERALEIDKGVTNKWNWRWIRLKDDDGVEFSKWLPHQLCNKSELLLKDIEMTVWIDSDVTCKCKLTVELPHQLCNLNCC